MSLEAYQSSLICLVFLVARCRMWICKPACLSMCVIFGRVIECLAMTTKHNVMPVQDAEIHHSIGPEACQSPFHSNVANLLLLPHNMFSLEKVSWNSEFQNPIMPLQLMETFQLSLPEDPEFLQTDQNISRTFKFSVRDYSNHFQVLYVCSKCNYSAVHLCSASLFCPEVFQRQSSLTVLL